MLNKLFIDLRDHAKNDHLLLHLLVFLSSESDADVVLEHASAHLFAIRVSQLCSNRDEKLNKNQVRNL